MVVSTWCPLCFYSSYWLYNEGKIKSAFCRFTFYSVLHLLIFSRITDIGRLHMTFWFCLNWSSCVQHIFRQEQWVRVARGKKNICFESGEGKFLFFWGRGWGSFCFFPPESLLYSASQILLNPCCFAYINTVSWLLPATRTAEGGCSRSRCRVQAVWPRCQCQRELLCSCWSARHRYWN